MNFKFIILILLVIIFVYITYIKSNENEKFTNNNVNLEDSVNIVTCEQGEKGDTGDRGFRGIQGPQGDKGNQGVRGIRGAEGDPGPKGLSALDVLKRNSDDLDDELKTNLFGDTINDNDTILTTLDGFKNHIKNKLQTELQVKIPARTIVAYNDLNAPKGWQLCDGRNLKDTNNNEITDENGNKESTPDLRGRFVLGAGNLIKNNNNDTSFPDHDIGETDQNGNIDGTLGRIEGEYNLNSHKIKKINNDFLIGSTVHKLSIEEIPEHSHNIKRTNVERNKYTCANNAAFIVSRECCATNNVTNVDDTGIDSTPGDKPHNNMPPFICLTYIIKQPSSS